MRYFWLLCVMHVFAADVVMKGIVLVNGKSELVGQPILENADGVMVVDLDLPSSEGILADELAEFLNGKTKMTQENVRKVKEALYQYYRSYDYPFVIISVPQQKADTGVLQIVVNESTLGKMDVKGNEWTKAERYDEYFTLKPGEPISQKKLTNDVNFMNRNPYRQVTVVYSPGDELYTTDLTLEVADRKPYFFYAGFDNTGVVTTGRERVFAGFSWDQMFGLDQTFFYQYSTNYHVQDFHSNSFQYMAMLPWKSILNLYGGFSVVSADLPSPARTNSGTSIQGSFRYIAPFSTSRFFSQEMIFGADVKSTNNTMEFVDIEPVFGQTVVITQLMLGYRAKYERGCMEVEGGVEGYTSPAEFFPSVQSEADFRSLRPGAENKWFYLLGYCNTKYPLPHGCALHFRGRLEWASCALMPSEQLGIGGHASVRGYDERAYNADDGFVGSIEILFPRFALIPTKKKGLVNSGYFLFFTDGGFGFDNRRVPEIPKGDWLASTGLGFRYFLNTYLNARVDYGFKLHQQAGFTGGSSMCHFSVSGSY